MIRPRLYAIAASLTLLLGHGAQAQPTVVELFTSQGCSSCPPANASLAAISRRPDVLALSFGVVYWDYLGWKDTFAKREFTERQISYERGLGRSGPFTPQIVVNGATDTVGNELSAVQSLVDSARLAGPAISLAGDAVSVGASTVAGAADVWLVRYDPRTIDVPVTRGENEGAALPHKNVVRELTHLGTWSGRAATYRISPAARGLSTAILVQKPNGGAIIAAFKG